MAAERRQAGAGRGPAVQGSEVSPPSRRQGGVHRQDSWKHTPQQQAMVGPRGRLEALMDEMTVLAKARGHRTVEGCGPRGWTGAGSLQLGCPCGLGVVRLRPCHVGRENPHVPSTGRALALHPAKLCSPTEGILQGPPAAMGPRGRLPAEGRPCCAHCQVGGPLVASGTRCSDPFRRFCEQR